MHNGLLNSKEINELSFLSYKLYILDNTLAALCAPHATTPAQPGFSLYSSFRGALTAGCRCNPWPDQSQSTISVIG